MKNQKAYAVFLFFLFSLAFVSATCTVTFDKDSYLPSQVVTATMTCSAVNEKLDAYTLNWTQNGTIQLELDTGTTPSSVNTPFYETYVLANDFYGTINATMTGGDTEGDDGATVAGSSSNSLVINQTDFSPDSYIGKLFSLEYTVKDENGKLISNAHCFTFATDNNNAPVQVCGESYSHNGRGTCSGLLSPSLNEGEEYIARTRCNCGVGDNACFDEDGSVVNLSTGSTTTPFTVSSWLNVNTVVDQTNYFQKEEIVICVNLTNPTYSSNIPVNIYHQIRCSSGTDNSGDLDRTLIISDDDDPDDRQADIGTTQMQCKRFVVPEPRYLQGKSSQCYASTNVWVVNDMKDEIFSYTTISPVFNITLSDLQLQPDWQRESEYSWETSINLSADSYRDYSGAGNANIDIRIDKVESFIRSYKQDILPEIEFNNFLISRYIKNITTTYCNGTTISSGIEINDDGHLEIELRDVGISNDGKNCYNVTMNLNDFEDRQSNALESSLPFYNRSATALEGIENKTGTFHLDVECPVEAPTGEEMDCAITAYIEEDQLTEKEVDFTCYISVNGSRLSSLNFNQMITRTSQTFHRKFLVPDSLAPGDQHTLQCEAGYYNLGSRTDTFYDTFLVIDQREGDEGVAGTTTLPEVTDERGVFEKITEKIKEIKDEGLPFYINLIIGGVILLLFIFLIILLIAVIKRRKKNSG